MARPVAFEGIEVFDGDGWIGERTVVVADGTIVAVTDAGAPRDARTIAGAGKTLLPGFIDTHVHLGFFDPAVVLRAGVTTARDLGWPLAEIARIARSGEGPDVRFAGPIVTPRGGYPSRAAWAPPGTAREVDDDAHAASVVAELAAAGVAAVKIAAVRGHAFAPSVLSAIVTAAHAAELPVVAHVDHLGEMDACVRAGVDQLAHGLWSDEEVPDATLREMVAAGVVVIPTLHIDPSPARMRTVARFAGAGGRVVYGTDMGNRPVPPGIDVEELSLMRAAGMSLEAVLRAATADAAALLGATDRGRVAEGMRADLVVAAGDLRAGLAPLGAPSVVVARGAVVR